MSAKLQYFNSQEAAKILGINVSTIKRWTDEGKLKCIRSAGGHRKFLFHHLADFLENQNQVKSKVSIFPVENTTDLEISRYILKGDFDYLQDFALELALSCDRNRLLQVFKGLYLAQFPLHEIYDKLVTKLLHKTGELWEQGRISVAQEHITTQTVRDSLIRLQAVINIPAKKSSNVMCLNFSDELHDIALKMVDHILESSGYNILFSGQITPMVDIEQLFETFQPEYVCISSTVVWDQKKSQQEFDELAGLCEKYGSKLCIGGSGFEKIDLTAGRVEGIIESFSHLYLFFNPEIEEKN